MTTERSKHIEAITALSQSDAITAEALKARLNDEAASARYILQMDDLTIDFSRQSLGDDALDALIAWGQSILPKRDAMLAGEVVNASEKSPALHTSLRDPDSPAAQQNVAEMAAMAERILSLGVDDVVAIGVGGSHLGPATVVEALKPFQQGVDIHFVANLDPSHLDDILVMLNPLTTAVVTVSKTFTTKEMRANMDVARKWLDNNGINSGERLFAVTAEPSKAEQAGIEPENILTMDKAIGGRFSLWSAVGLSIMLAMGEEVFIDLLAGAEQMDKHFAEAPVFENMPIIGGLIQTWNRSFLGHGSLAVIPYDQRLSQLPAWLQQLIMESNGKSTMEDGTPTDLPTSPTVIGEVGSTSQHSFFQMFHQSDEIIPVDFLAPLTPLSLIEDGEGQVDIRHRDLIAQMLAQADCLALGALSGFTEDKAFTGGRPSTVITWQATTPFAIGRILAYYEHLTAVSGWLLGINSFDQPGVELGKKIAENYIAFIIQDENSDTIPALSKTYLNQLKK